MNNLFCSIIIKLKELNLRTLAFKNRKCIIQYFEGTLNDSYIPCDNDGMKFGFFIYEYVDASGDIKVLEDLYREHIIGLDKKYGHNSQTRKEKIGQYLSLRDKLDKWYAKEC